jgi:hypothetical protein
MGFGPQIPAPAAADGGGSLLFGQADATLTASLPWRAPVATHLAGATVTVAEAVDGDVDLVHVVVNGSSVATLSLADGETTSTATLDVDVDEADRVGVVRLSVDGGACQVQLDRGAGA